jgi:transposase-like protein
LFKNYPKMSRKVRRQFDGKFKAQVVTEVLRERKTLNELCKEYDLHPNQITDWKKQLVNGMADFFDTSPSKSHMVDEAEIELITSPLYQQIGQLKVELDYLKKKCRSTK